MKFLSVCSGIEAASMAWRPLGWKAVAFAEIEPFPCAVLKHHYPEPNLGDMTKHADWPDDLLASADGLVGGTPCQAFSVGGNRQSLSDERGNLTLTYVNILNQIDAARDAAGRPPAFCLWENVPGVLSTADNAFGCFLGGLAGANGALRPPGGRWLNAGYVRGPRRAVAWRILDAQYFGLAQRRERVFVVAGAGDGFHPEQILFESEGVRRDSPPRREKGQTAPTIPSRSTAGGGPGTDFDCDGGLISMCLSQGGRLDAESETLVPMLARTLLGKANDSHAEDHDTYVIANNLNANSGGAQIESTYLPVAPTGGVIAVRRLLPIECARLQGFPDTYLDIPYRGKPACDGPKYKALGNSKAVPVVRWIGERIAAHVNNLPKPSSDVNK